MEWSVSCPFHRQQPALILPNPRLWKWSMALVLLLLCPWMLMDPVTDIWYCFPMVRYCGVALNSEGTALPRADSWPSSLSSWNNPAPAASVNADNFPPKMLSAYSPLALQCDYKDILGDHPEGLTSQVYNILCSPFVHTISCPILDAHGICQERFVLGKSVLVFPIIFYSFTCLKMFP